MQKKEPNSPFSRWDGIMAKIAVVGAGAYGTALAAYSVNIGHDVKVWCFERNLPDLVKRTGENELYLPGIKLPEKLVFTNDPTEAVASADMVIMVSPSAHVRNTSKLISSTISKDALIVSAAKGIEQGTLNLMSQVLEDTLSDHADRLSYISGPSFARDVANGLPTDLACASHSIEVAHAVQEILHSSTLRIYSNDDVVGVELGGALKNVIAVACGAVDAMHLGLSARASLMTRGLAEITRLGVAMGAKTVSFLGLAGMGDLVLTCTGDLSRNYTLGKRLALGEKAADIIHSQNSVAEGYVTVKPAVELAHKHNVDMPICEAVYKVCYENADIREEGLKLMSRTMKDEFAGM
jgi:glycerol-3-phosphate dehydrogenase (NAD(P)+)